MTGTEPHEERWAYGGIRLLHAERMFAWLPDSGNGQELLLVPMKGSYTVGLLYRVWVTRADGRAIVHGWPRYANRRVEPGLAALLRAEHYAAHTRLALARIKPPPIGRIALDEAIEPVRVIARGADQPRRPDRPPRLRRRGAVLGPAPAESAPGAERR